MVSLRIDDEKFQNLCKNNYLIGKKVDELKNMIDESANKIDVAFKQVELLKGEAALAAQKKDDSHGKLDVKIKNNKEKLKAVRMEINSAKLEIDSMKLEPLLKKKAVSDFKLEEELKAAKEKLMEKKAELEEELDKHSLLLGIMEMANKAMSDCKESMELVQQIICLRLKAVSKRLQATKVRYIILTELADLHIIGHICNNARSFHHFSLKFNIGRSLHISAEGLLSESIRRWSKNDITSVGAGKVYKISVNENVVRFTTLTALEAQEAGFKL